MTGSKMSKGRNASTTVGNHCLGLWIDIVLTVYTSGLQPFLYSLPPTGIVLENHPLSYNFCVP